MKIVNRKNMTNINLILKSNKNFFKNLKLYSFEYSEKLYFCYNCTLSEWYDDLSKNT